MLSHHSYRLAFLVLLLATPLLAQQQTTVPAPAPATSATSATAASATTASPASTNPSASVATTLQNYQLTADQGTKAKKDKFLFTGDEVLGAGGSVFVGDAIQIRPGILNNGYYGGNFFFGFANFLRLGIQGAIIETLSPVTDTQSASLQGFYVGGFAAGVWKLGVLSIVGSTTLAYGNLLQQPSFVIGPELGLALRVTKEFAISVNSSLLMFLNSTSMNTSDDFVKSIFPTIALQIQFGAV